MGDKRVKMEEGSEKEAWQEDVRIIDKAYIRVRDMEERESFEWEKRQR